MSLYDLQTACYHSLQRVLVLLGQENQALVVAERSRTRPFLDLLRDKLVKIKFLRDKKIA